MLKHMGVNDCLSSATAGLTTDSITKIKKHKNVSYTASKQRATSGALRMQDVGLCTSTGNHIRSSNSTMAGRRRTAPKQMSIAMLQMQMEESEALK